MFRIAPPPFSLKIVLAVALLCLLSARTPAQTADTVYTQEYLSKSTRFAWLTLGGGLLVNQGGQTDFLANGQATGNTNFGAGVLPRLTIGGIHFWGHADFYVTFPLGFIGAQSRPDNFGALTLRQGIETGARVYPFKLQPGRISPFAGISFRPMRYSHEVNALEYNNGAPGFESIVTPIELGLTYTTNKWLFMASAYYQPNNTEFNYALSTTQTGRTSIEPLSFAVNVLRYWDTDAFMREPKAVRRLNRMHQILKEANHLNSWYWALGPSAGLQMSRSEYLEETHPYLANEFIGGFMPDVAFGRYFYKPDLNVGISYRTFGEQLAAFDTDIQLRRHSVMLESYKFLFNWLGFVPFIGATASIENLRTTVNGQAFVETKPAVGFIVGWDIRVTHTGTSLLRTNLRWVPNLHMEVQGQKMMFDQLEFNFIQWVQFIGRKKTYAQYRQ